MTKSFWAAAGLVFLSGAAVPAVAQTTSSSAAETLREAEMFGSETDAREAEMFGSETDAREAEMFGNETDAREADMFGSEDREADMFGETSTASPAALPRSPSPFSPSTENRLADALEERQDILAIGGQMWLWLQYTLQEDTNAAISPISSPSFVDVYLDARPTDRLRGYIRGRLNWDPTIDGSATDFLGQPVSGTQVRLDQLWLKLDIERRVFLTAGKQRIRWGTGRIWNPTDFMNAQRLDAVNFLDVRLGVTLLKVHVPIESLGWNLYALADLEGAGSPEEVGAALRAEIVLGEAEIAASAAYKRGIPWRFGLDVSMPVWELDLRVEGAVLHDVRRPFFDERTDASFLNEQRTIDDATDLLRLQGEPVDRRNDWIPQVVVGLDYAFRYNDEDIATLSLEYLYNDAGTNRTEEYIPLILNQAFEALYVGRHYAGLAFVLPAPGDWDESTFTLIGLANLSDQTSLVRFNYTANVLTYLSVNAFVAGFFGRSGGEFRLRQRIPPVDPDLVEGFGLPAFLGSGFEVLPPALQIGGTLVIDF